MKCETVKQYEGNQSQKILGMLADRARKELKKEIPVLQKDKYLVNSIKEMQRLEKELADVKEVVRENELRLKIKWKPDYSSKGYEPHPAYCFVTKSQQEELQKASDLWSLGKKIEAAAIWDKYEKQLGLL